MKRAPLLAAIAFLVFVAASPVDVNDFAKGETLDYDLTWLSVIGGGMRLTIVGEGDQLRITSVAASDPTFAKIYKVRDEIESRVLRDSFSTVEYRKVLDENGKKREDTTTIDATRQIGTRIRKGKAPATFHIVPPPPYLDPLSVVYRLRTVDLAPGKAYTYTVYADGNVYEMTVTVRPDRETLNTPFGTFKAVSVEPRMKGRGGLFRDDNSRLLIWYTDDARHLPLRIRSELKFGSITATLRVVSSGVKSIEPDSK